MTSYITWKEYEIEQELEEQRFKENLKLIESIKMKGGEENDSK